MNTYKENILFGIIVIALIFVFIVGFYLFAIEYHNSKNTSTPVEEMYHRQLVNTIDSILDSRYPCGITEDDSDYPSIDSLSNIAVPNNR